MPEPTILHALTVTQGLPASFGFRFSSNYPEARTPVDMSTGWTGTFIVTDEPGGNVLLEQPIPDLGPDGLIMVNLTADQTAAMTPSRHIGGRVAACFQINLDYDDPSLSQVWQGALTIARAAR